MEPRLRVGLELGAEQVRVRVLAPRRLVDLPGGAPVAALPAGAVLAFRPAAVEGVEAVGVGDPARAAAFRLEPAGSDGRFVLLGMTVGRGFHWEHREDLVFSGALEVRPGAGGGLDAVEEVGLEDYLVSVVSSEMSARCPPELLRAHAIASRSWLVAQLEGTLTRAAPPPAGLREAPDGALEWTRWTDREAHRDFDVCADDHCQRYQGATRASTPAAREAVKATRGLVLVHGGRACDARFAKACGGLTERFSAAWGDVDVPYLSPVADGEGLPAPPLPGEGAARDFILGDGAGAWCGTRDRALLERVLPEIDHDTRSFFRWEARVPAALVRRRLGERLDVDPGEVEALVPLERGASGRVVRLEVRGSRRVVRVGKELEVRAVLSGSHLYSSAFVVVGRDGGDFLLRGAGWGHGVGMCQVGAAAMAAAGVDHRAILAHYYPGAGLARRY